MPQSETFDVVILGSGQGGKQLAWHLGRSGKKVAVVERRWFGGSCPAVACLPSKNEIWGAPLIGDQPRLTATAIKTNPNIVRNGDLKCAIQDY
jgi:pyruvate/2-oxoglutarate dehydrogenase complex dihydrolipoamide dehydrogenase (E3) component